MSPWFLVVFFGIFQALGGVMFGQGVRALWTEPEKAKGLVITGALVGGVLMLFDWAFFIQQGQRLYGLIGPAIFIVAALFTSFLLGGPLRRFDGKAIGMLGVGIAAVLLGILAAPFLLGQSYEAGSMELVLGACWVLMFVVIGSGFALTGLRALLHERTFDQEVAMNQTVAKASGKRGGRKPSSHAKDENDDSVPRVR